ncbi:MAG: M1 family peptidase, partial [Bacteroidota bacterium]|nr:M1 family peptidase [Bacteroidota bacterium]
RNEYREFRNSVNDEAIKLANSNKNFYEVTFKNNGGLVTPLIIEWTYQDNSVEIEKIPAEIWRFNEKEVTKVFTKDKVVKSIKLDPNKETADVNLNDNNYPRVEIKTDFDRFNN